MGNQLSCGLVNPPGASRDVVKLIHYNGTMDEFYRAVATGELRLDYPEHVIVRSRDLLIIANAQDEAGRRAPPAMSDNAHMQLGHVYFILHRGVVEAGFRPREAAALLAKAPSLDDNFGLLRRLRFRGAAHIARILPAELDYPILLPLSQHENNREPDNESDIHGDYVRKLLAESRQKLASRNCEVSCSRGARQLSNYLRRTYSSEWKPSLDTIHEYGLVYCSSGNIVES